MRARSLSRAVPVGPVQIAVRWASACSVGVYPGDGIGAVEEKQGFKLQQLWYPWGCEYSDGTGEAAPNDMIEILRPHDAVFLRAVGYPGRLPEHITLERPIRMRQAFDQFVPRRARYMYGKGGARAWRWRGSGIAHLSRSHLPPAPIFRQLPSAASGQPWGTLAQRAAPCRGARALFKASRASLGRCWP